MLLGLTLALSGGGAWYLASYIRRERETRHREQRRQREQFQAALVRELRGKRLSEFSFSGFVTTCDILREDADVAADDVYRELCHKALADGVVTAEERKKLDVLARALEIATDRAARLESETKGEVYHRAVEGVVADGIVTADEASSLELLRESLGIGRRASLEITETLARDTYLSALKKVVRRGRVTMADKEELQRIKRALAVSDADAARFAGARDEAIGMYRQLFTSVMQDGLVTPEEEEVLLWLQGEVRLPEHLTASCKQRLERAKRLNAAYQGSLPSIRTQRILESGEICHWESPCNLQYATRTKIASASGQLILTSKQIYFSSPTKSFGFAPSKILDITRYSNAVELATATNRGNGTYFVDDSESLTAILFGVVRKHKYLATEGFSAAASRHIPHDVRAEVWSRDGGRCVECQADDYLEFDHIIPHSRGGANTVNNVRLLCRRCNLAKSDRI
jgi:hypothetical protein